jgi:TRAP-type C4-dicarboxylate transport system substrate-binding protein
VVYQKTLWQQASDDALEKVKAHGVAVIYPDKTSFIQAVQPMLQALQGSAVGDLVNKITAVHVVPVTGAATTQPVTTTPVMTGGSDE